ncbi:terpene synthase family protein [Streptomyces sp. NPDC048290]|uniref:terpene synthase family protein n=1 Tax=Streptomyces sp. NPDC048290 TaxID=3155811 RepID=UPI0034186CB0
MDESTLTPLLDIPFTGAVSPHIDDVRDWMWAWIRDLDLLDSPATEEKLRVLKVERFAARLHPYTELEAVVVMTAWGVTGWLWDDLLDDRRLPLATCRKVVDGLADICRGARPRPATALERAWADAWDRSLQGRTPTWVTACTQDLVEHLNSYAVEAEHRMRDHVPSIRDYVDHRIVSTGVRAFVRLLEGGGDALDPLWHNSAAIRTIRDSTAAQIGIVNDIFSADREEARGYYHNAVLILQRTTGCSRAEAAEGAAALANEYVDHFRSARSAMPQELAELGLDTSAAAAADEYARRCGAMMRGSYDWHLETQRYVMPTAGPGVLVP